MADAVRVGLDRFVLALGSEEFSCLAEARVLTEDWRIAYNAEHLHSALGYRSPNAFAAAWTPATS